MPCLCLRYSDIKQLANKIQTFSARWIRILRINTLDIFQVVYIALL